MRDWWEKFRKTLKPLVATAVSGLLIWAALEVRAGFFEGSGWGPRQWAEKFGQWATGGPGAEKGKLETGSIPSAKEPAPSPSAYVRKAKDVTVRAKKVRCERERMADLVDAERELAVSEYRVVACIQEAKGSIFTSRNPERACKAEIDGRNASKVRREASAARRC